MNALVGGSIHRNGSTSRTLVSRNVEITVKSTRRKRPTNVRLLRFCAIQGLLHNKNGNVRFIPAYPRPDGLSE
jgi:hypothetical protein